MCTDEDAVFQFRAVAGDDVVREQGRTVEAFQRGPLLDNLETIAGELLGYPLAALLVGLAVHRPGAEVTLPLAEGVGRVSRERRADLLGSSTAFTLGRSIS